MRWKITGCYGDNSTAFLVMQLQSYEDDNSIRTSMLAPRTNVTHACEDLHKTPCVHSVRPKFECARHNILWPHKVTQFPDSKF